MDKEGRSSSHLSRVPVTDAVHAQGLLGWGPALRQWGHLPTLLLQLPDSPLCHSQLLLLCLLGTQGAGAQVRLQWKPPAPFPSPKRGVASIRGEVSIRLAVDR